MARKIHNHIERYVYRYSYVQRDFKTFKLMPVFLPTTYKYCQQVLPVYAYKSDSVMLLFTVTICLFLLHAANPCVGNSLCNERFYETGTVCVCNSTYCDNVSSIGQIDTDEYEIYRTSQKTLGFHKSGGKFEIDNAPSGNIIRVNIAEKYQSIIGFGGTFTDATGININELPTQAQTNLLNSYFADDGLGYSLCRVPIGGTDFSTRGYSYDEVNGDGTLQHFELQNEDLEFKVRPKIS